MSNEIIAALKSGNETYKAGLANPADISAELRRGLAENGQRPDAVIITCSDSRVPPEHIFSRGLGELFVIRTAGNVVGDFERGTAEYAVMHLGVRLIVVMGHTRCGAVDAAMADAEHGGAHPAALGALVEEVRRGVCDCGGDTRNALRANVENSVVRVLESAVLRAEHESGGLMVARAMYDMDTGSVEFW